MLEPAAPISDRPRPLWPAYLAAAGLILLLRPYRGLVHDSRIYIGRAIADLDTQGVGQDLMFLRDGQTGWTIFRPVARWLVEMVGPSAAAEGLVIVGLLLWSLALVALATTLFGRRSRWVAVLSALALPGFYGAFDSFSFAEPWATPRLFAEAAAIAGLGLILNKRWALGLAAVAGGALFHPLMTLPVILVIFLWLALVERRLWFAAAAGGIVFLAAAAAGAPMAARLLQGVEPGWAQLLALRSPYLYPRLWPAEIWCRLSVQIATLLIAHSVIPSLPARRLLTAVLVATGLALAAAVLLSSSLLILQLQLWRTTWVLAVLANAAAGLLAIELWRHQRLGAATLAALAVAWLVADTPVGAIVAVGAASAWGILHGRPVMLSARAVRAAVIAVGALCLLWTAYRVFAFAGVAIAAPPQVTRELWLYGLAAGLGILLLPVVVGWTLLGAAERWPRWMLAAGAVALCVLGVSQFDCRSQFRQRLESGQLHAEFRSVAPPISGPVYWAQFDVAPWLVAGRAAWASSLQAAPALFSRDLAIGVRRRFERLAALGLEHPDALTPFTREVRPDTTIRARPQAVGSLCALQDGPSAVVLRDRQAEAVPVGARAVYWRPSIPEFRYDAALGIWRRTDVFTVIPCPRVSAAPARPASSGSR
jgi:hypothetical protein